MRTWRRWLLLGWIVVVGWWGGPGGPAPARAAWDGDPQRVQVTFEEMGYPDRKAVGAASTVSYDLVLPRAWQRPGTLRVVLDISHSRLLLASRSVVTVAFNDLPVATFPLDTDNARHGRLVVEVPLDVPRPSRYRLDVIFYMRVNEEDCLDLNSPALWAIVHASSYVEVRLDEGASRWDLGAYPYPLVPARAVVPAQVHFVLPTPPSAAALEAVGRIAAKLGQLTGTDWVTYTVGGWEDAPPDAGVFVVGTPAEQPLLAALAGRLPLPLTGDGMNFVYPTGEPIPPDWGILQLIPDPTQPQRPLLIVSGGNAVGLQRAGTALASQASLDLFQGDFAIIPTVEAAGADALYGGLRHRAQGRMTLASLTGHTQDWMVRGAGQSSLSFTFFLPGVWKMQDSAYFSLHLAHSPTLWADRSVLEVYLNGRLLHVEPLDEENAMPTTIQVSLPAKLLRPGRNEIALRFTLNLRTERCVHEFPEDAWAQVFADSLIVLPHEEEQRPYRPELADYPYPFNDDPGLASTWVLLPDEPTAGELTAAVRILARLGRSASSQALQPHLAYASALPAAQRAGKHLLVLDVGRRNALLQEIAPRLQVAGRSVKAWQVPEGAPAAQVVDRAPVGVIEALVSPWDATHAVWVISGNEERAFMWAADALAFGETADELGGDVALFTEGPLEGGRVRVFSTLPTPTPLPDDQVPTEQVPTVPAPLTWFFGSLVVILGALVLFVLQGVRERRREAEREEVS